MILREAKPPRPWRNPRRWAYYPAAFFFGLGLGSIAWFGQYALGTFLVAGSLLLYWYARDGLLR